MFDYIRVMRLYNLAALLDAAASNAEGLSWRLQLEHLLTSAFITALTASPTFSYVKEKTLCNWVLLPNFACMSWWERWLAPGDLRQQLQQDRAAAIASKASPLSPNTLSQDDQPLKSLEAERLSRAQREQRKNAIFLGGIAFTIASLTITRRALRKRRLLTWPRFYTPSNTPPVKVDGGMEAVDALFLATVNVCSFFMTAVGFGMVAFDVAEVEDLRAMVRKGVGFDVYAGSREADKEIEGWVMEALGNKEGEKVTEKVLSQGGILAKLGKLAEVADREEKSRKAREDKTAA